MEDLLGEVGRALRAEAHKVVEATVTLRRALLLMARDDLILEDAKPRPLRLQTARRAPRHAAAALRSSSCCCSTTTTTATAAAAAAAAVAVLATAADAVSARRRRYLCSLLRLRLGALLQLGLRRLDGPVEGVPFAQQRRQRPGVAHHEDAVDVARIELLPLSDNLGARARRRVWPCAHEHRHRRRVACLGHVPLAHKDDTHPPVVCVEHRARTQRQIGEFGGAWLEGHGLWVGHETPNLSVSLSLCLSLTLRGVRTAASSVQMKPGRAHGGQQRRHQPAVKT